MLENNLQSLQEFGDKFGIGRTTLYELVRGREASKGVWVKPSLDTMLKLAHALNQPLHKIVYLIEPDAPGADSVQAATDSLHALKIPVMVAGCVGAGTEQAIPTQAVAYVESTFAKGKNLVAYQVIGNSMEGGKNPIQDGSIVVVNTLDLGNNNSAVVARIRGNGYVCKRLKKSGTGKLVCLDSQNPEFQDPNYAVIPPEQVDQVVGRVVRVIQNI